MHDSILSTEGLTKDFGGLRVLNDLDITVKNGHIHSLIGPNGAGKTTFFNVVTGMFPPDSGTIHFNSTEITNLKPQIIARNGISRTFQAAILAQGLTALENVMIGMHVRTSANMGATLFRLPFTSSSQENRMKSRAMELLDLVGLTASAKRWAGELVWVERQLVQIARAIAAEPKLLLLDEPTGGMGAKESEKVEGIIRQICHELKMSVIVIAHDVRLLASISDWVTCIDFGGKIAEGTPEEIRTNPKVLEAYLGKE